jgi:hypothetical protein
MKVRMPAFWGKSMANERSDRSNSALGALDGAMAMAVVVRIDKQEGSMASNAKQISGGAHSTPRSSTYIRDDKASRNDLFAAKSPRIFQSLIAPQVFTLARLGIVGTAYSLARSITKQ